MHVFNSFSAKFGLIQQLSSACFRCSAPNACRGKLLILPFSGSAPWGGTLYVFGLSVRPSVHPAGCALSRYRDIYRMPNCILLKFGKVIMLHAKMN